MTAAVAAIPWRSRLFGLGSVFGKAVRDSRRAFLVEVAFLGGYLLVVLAGMANVYATRESREQIVRLAQEMGPAAQGLTGPPVNVGTMGGYVQWKYGSVFLLIAAFWSILTLSGTLAGEARRGSLDLVAATPHSRRRIAIEKVAAHGMLLAAVAVVVAGAALVAGAAFARLPGDDIPAPAATGFAAWIAVMALAFGALAFALAQFLGRRAAAWISGVVLVAGPILTNYRALMPELGPLAALTPWAWTAGHVPLAGRYDWASLVPVAAIAVGLAVVGVEAFARRDVGDFVAVRVPHPPAVVLGLRGPAWRSFAERLPLALAWGLGLGTFGFLMAAASGPLATLFADSPDLERTIGRVFPDHDLATAGGFLQLMVQLLFIAAGFAAAGLVGGWARDETAGRLEQVLAAPLTRRSLALRSGLGVLAAIAVMTAVIAGLVGIGAAATSQGTGGAALTPMAGAVSLGLFAAALAGVGFAAGGLARASLAARVVAAIVVATYLLDLLIPALRLPEQVRELALTAHLGQPMVGDWNPTGVVACLALAGGGLVLGALGFARRDLAA